ncbi:Peptidase A1 domain-containing protein [Aphelenchoides bicaudatus]|nr:Peptidase A1 domain-containing protein [Aphelenchoides bicaudatus]
MMKLFVFLLCLLVIADALPAVRNKKSGGHRMKLTRKKLTYQRAKEYVQKVPKTSKFFQEQTPLIDDGLATVWQMGMPENTYLFRVETGSRGVFVAGDNYPGGSEEPYFTSKSKTAKKLSGTLSGTSGNNNWSGEKWQDNFDDAFNNITQNFALLSSIDGGFITNPHLTFTVLLGFGWLPEDVTAKPGPDSPIVVNALTFDKKEYAIVFMRSEEDDKEEEDFWEMDYDGARICDKDNSFDLLPRSDKRFAPMAFVVDGFKFENYEKKGPFTGRLDTSVSHIYVPSGIYSAIQKKVDIKYESEIGLSMIACNAGDTLGDLIFTLNGQQYNIPSSEYIVDIDSPDGLCVFFVAQTVFDVDFVFGLTFLQTYCSYYSLQDNQVGLGIPAIN